jgi:ABC-type sugar transport system substrate-binding protein
MKKFLASLAIAGMALLPSEALAQKKKVDVAVVGGLSDITQFHGQFFLGIRDILENYQDADIKVTTYSPAGGLEDEIGMDKILTDMVTLAPNYVVFIVVHWDTVQDRLVALQKAGVNLMVVEFAPKNAGDVKPFAWAVTDHMESGRVTGKSAAEHMCRDHQGEVVKAALFHGTAASEIGIERMKGIQETFPTGLAACGKKVEIVDEVFANFNRERAFQLAQQVATAHPDINIMFGANSNTSLGIMEGLRTVNMLDKVRITGIGGQLEELAAICRREILTAGVRDPRGQGKNAGNAIVGHMEGKPFEEMNYAPQVAVSNCEEVFAFYPVEMLDNPSFKNNIDADQWKPKN